MHETKSQAEIKEVIVEATTQVSNEKLNIFLRTSRSDFDKRC